MKKAIKYFQYVLGRMWRDKNASKNSSLAANTAYIIKLNDEMCGTQRFVHFMTWIHEMVWCHALISKKNYL